MLDDWQVDCGVLFPTIGILPFPTDDRSSPRPIAAPTTAGRRSSSRARPGRVVPIALVNWRDVDEAVRELEICLKAGFRGLFTPPETIDGRRPGDPHFDPIWRLCEEAGVPGCLHVIVRFGGGGAFAHWQETRPGTVFAFAIGATGQLIPAVAAMVIDLLFERFPALKIVWVEAGCGWAAYLMDRLDEKHDIFHAHRADADEAERLHPAQLLLRRRTGGAHDRRDARPGRRGSHPLGQRLPARGLDARGGPA